MDGIKNLLRAACSKYSAFDDLVISKASELNMPLIGGTALEVLGSHFNNPGCRKRSENDLDFIATDANNLDSFQEWLFGNIDSSRVSVDVYLADENVLRYSMSANGVRVMRPEYLIWAKLTRPDRSQKDLDDIKWLLSIKQMSDDDLSAALNDLGVTDAEINTLNTLL